LTGRGDRCRHSGGLGRDQIFVFVRNQFPAHVSI
jgi:hypothetical protein